MSAPEFAGRTALPSSTTTITSRVECCDLASAPSSHRKVRMRSTQQRCLRSLMIVVRRCFAFVCVLCPSLRHSRDRHQKGSAMQSSQLVIYPKNARFAPSCLLTRAVCGSAGCLPDSHSSAWFADLACVHGFGCSTPQPFALEEGVRVIHRLWISDHSQRCPAAPYGFEEYATLRLDGTPPSWAILNTPAPADRTDRNQ